MKDDSSIGRRYPGSDSSGDCNTCPCETDGATFKQPSIFTKEVRDERASVDRRAYAKLLATIGGLTAIGSLAAPLVSLTRVFERKYTGPVYSDGIALVDEEGNTIPESHLSEGDVMTVFPENRPGINRAPTLLVRFNEDEYGGDTDLEATVSGYAAFSKVCTHAGCMVSNQEDTTLICPCHSGRFDAITGARVVGGPPPRPLPQLPLALSSEGYLIATGDFEGPVGPGGE